MKLAYTRIAVVCATVFFSAASASAQTLVINDPLKGSTVGKQSGGTFTKEGYQPASGQNHVLYVLPRTVSEGCAEFEIKGMDHAKVPKDADHGFFAMYDGRGIDEPIKYFNDFKSNFFRWNLHWRQNRAALKCVISCAGPTEERKKAKKAVYADGQRDWSAEPMGQKVDWDPKKWYTIRAEWRQKTFRVLVDGVENWKAEGKYDYTPVAHHVWLGCAPGQRDKYMAIVPGVTYRNFKLYEYDGAKVAGTLRVPSSGPRHTECACYFPPPGEGLDKQDRRKPEEVGLKPETIDQLKKQITTGRWAMWRHGYLVHVEGDFNEKTEVKSLRKTWHALTVGAALQQEKVPSLQQKVSVWNKELKGKDAEATWWHVITQTSGFDYPYADVPAYKPGEIWTYSDKNPHQLCNALARAYGKKDYKDDYDAIVKQAYFDAIGMRGWKTSIRADGIRFHFDLEDMGRLGLLVLARGRWNGKQIIPQDFVESLETKQTRGIKANYDGPDDGSVGGGWLREHKEKARECPYGYMTWVNTAGDLFPGTDRAWAQASGAGGACVLWNHKSGIVFAGLGVDTRRGTGGIPLDIEACIAGTNPLVRAKDRPPAKDLGPLGQVAKWAKVEIVLNGPDSQGRGKPNPFAIAADGLFTSPSGKKYKVPGFYDGDGKGGLDGNVWKVRFSADEMGKWTFTSTSEEKRLDGCAGSFTVTAPAKDASDFHRWGRLEYAGTAENKIRYLKFRDGPCWLKAGCDDPENFLGNFQHYDTPAKRKSAIDYLAGKGINSLYLVTHNIDGDHKDVWPWLGKDAKEAQANGGAGACFDVAKLEEWRDLFEHMQTKGMVPYLILEDDSAWKGYDHARYYREMVARFGYLPALLFNLGEEHNENYRLPDALKLMQLLKEIDPYDHPRGMHNVNSPDNDYVDARQVSFTSIQTGSPGGKRPDPLVHNQIAIDWIERCKARKRRVLMVGFDEGRPEEDRRAWWSAYLGGGVWEAHVLKPYDRPLSAWEKTWTELGGARAFLESLPFEEMEANNALVKAGKAFCLARPGAAYALYLPSGGNVTVDLAPEAAYEYAWWNPANGKSGRFQDSGRVDGGEQRFTAPGPGDWALRIVRKSERRP